MIRTVLFTVIALLAVPAYAGQPDKYEAFRIESTADNNMLISLLTQNGIPHSVDEHNRIWYPASSRDNVYKLSASITARSSPVTMALFPGHDIPNKVKEAFNDAKIAYTIRKAESGVYIEWSEEHAIIGSEITTYHIYSLEDAL